MEQEPISFYVDAVFCLLSVHKWSRFLQFSSVLAASIVVPGWYNPAGQASAAGVNILASQHALGSKSQSYCLKADKELNKGDNRSNQAAEREGSC